MGSERSEGVAFAAAVPAAGEMNGSVMERKKWNEWSGYEMNETE